MASETLGIGLVGPSVLSEAVFEAVFIVQAVLSTPANSLPRLPVREGPAAGKYVFGFRIDRLVPTGHKMSQNAFSGLPYHSRKGRGNSAKVWVHRVHRAFPAAMQ